MSNTQETAPNLLLDVEKQHYAYRRFGKAGGVPLVLLQHFRGTMDNWDPLVTNALAAHHDVILFDNAGVGGSSGAPATSVSDMASHVAISLGALSLGTVDLLGFSLGLRRATSRARLSHSGPPPRAGRQRPARQTRHEPLFQRRPCPCGSRHARLGGLPLAVLCPDRDQPSCGEGLPATAWHSHRRSQQPG